MKRVSMGLIIWEWVSTQLNKIYYDGPVIGTEMLIFYL